MSDGRRSFASGAASPARSVPGSEEALSPSGQVEPGVGLQGAKAPLPYLRSRNALKLILDLDQNIGRVQIPRPENWPKFLQNQGAKK